MNVFQHFSQPQQQQHLGNNLDSAIIGNIDNGVIDMSSSAPSVPLKRTRAKRSCDFCRQRKSRCDADASTPCSNCKAWGYTCEFQTVRKKRGPPSIYVDNLEKKCKKMESLLTALTNCSIKDLERNDFQYAGHIQPISPPDHSGSSSDEEDDTDFDADSQQREINKDYDSIKYTGQSSAGLRLFGSDVFKAQSSIPWPGRENIVLKLMSQDELMIVRTEKSQTTGKSDMFLDVGLSMRAPLFDNSTKNSSITAQSSTASSAISKSLKKPARHQLDKMIGMYISHLHLILPIVDKKKFLEQYHKSSSGPPSILLQAVLALTFRFASRNLPDLVKDAESFADFYFRKVMKRLRDSSRSRLCQVQAALLMVQYLDMDDGDVDSIQWCTLGSAIRMAQDLGLHRSCAKWNLPRSEIETRHRVFYACYIMDRWLGARAGKPLTILDRDFDTDMPSPYEITDEDNDFESEDQQRLPTYRCFILMIKLSIILGRVLKSLYAPNAKSANSNAGLDDPTILTVFDRRLKNWKDMLNEPLDDLYLTEIEKANLQLYYYAVVLLLRRPFGSLSATMYPELQSIVTESEKACIDAAKKLSSIVRRRQYQKTEPAYYFVLSAPTCFVYALFQSSLAFLSNALKTRSRSDIQALHQSISLIKNHMDLGPAPRAVEILEMLASINHLHVDDQDTSPIQSHDATPSTISPTISSPPNNNGASLFNSRNDDDEIPKATYFQHRMVNTSTVGGFTPDIQQQDMKVVMSHQEGCHMQQQRSLSQSSEQQQQRNNYYSQNHPVYSNVNRYPPHQRSFSADQNQQNYTQCNRPDPYNHHEMYNSSTRPLPHPTSSSASSTSAPLGMNANNLVTDCYTPPMNNPAISPPQQHSTAMAMPSYTTPLLQTPQAYTAAYDPNMNVSNTTLPPSSLNWSDWDVYIGHQNQNLPSQQQQQQQQQLPPPSSQNIHYS